MSSGMFKFEQIEEYKTVKLDLRDDGRFLGYGPVRNMLTCSKSPNDSLLYWMHFEYKKTKEPIYINYRPTGRLILSVKELFPPFRVDSVVLNGNFTLWSFSVFADITRYNIQKTNNGQIAFIRNHDKIRGTNQAMVYLSFIKNPNQFDNLASRIRQKQFILDTLKRYDFGYYLPLSSTPYKKLRFLRGKTCTNELRLFADADSFYQNFEWHIANDTGGYDVFTGKNLKYPSKGKRTFYVKVKGIAQSGYFA